MIVLSRYVMWILVAAPALYSCENESIGLKRFIGSIHKKEMHCSTSAIRFQKEHFTVKDKAIKNLFSQINSIDTLIAHNAIKLIKSKENKFGSFEVYGESKNTIKIVSEIFVRRLRLASIKHEIYFLDDCTTIAKMTKYAYRSERIKAVYYFSFYKDEYIGCIVESRFGFIRKKVKWNNISDELVAKNWSKRIYTNIIAPEMKGLKN